MGSKQYRIVKFYKICDLTTAKSIYLKDVFSFCLLFFKDDINYSEVAYDVNYGQKAFKGLDKLKAYIEKKDTTKLVALTCYSGRSFISMENQALNSVSQKNSFCSIEIAFDEESFDTLRLENLSSSLYRVFNYDYGYSLSLSSDYDFVTEKKVKRSLFGVSTSIDEDIVFWISHMANINSGYLKDVYPINLLNEKHMIQNTILDLQESNVGTFRKLNESIWVWSLDGNKINLAKDALLKAKYLISK
jgi:hypothetical protein